MISAWFSDTVPFRDSLVAANARIQHLLGTGTVLLPWALLSFLQEDGVRGFGLLALYGLCSISRAVLEPHLVGKQLGLPPLLTLMAFYVGYRLFGVPGMVLLPLAVILVKPFLHEPTKTENN